eukprot:scaffold136451_cov36-Tisochrysis_lutea.AAC.1
MQQQHHARIGVRASALRGVGWMISILLGTAWARKPKPKGNSLSSARLRLQTTINVHPPPAVVPGACRKGGLN